VARLAPKVLNLNESDRSELQQLINRHNTAQQLVQDGGNKPSIRWLRLYPYMGLSRDSCKKVPLTLADIILRGFEEQSSEIKPLF
jgi:hypothetical protein